MGFESRERNLSTTRAIVKKALEDFDGVTRSRLVNAVSEKLSVTKTTAEDYVSDALSGVETEEAPCGMRLKGVQPTASLGDEVVFDELVDYYLKTFKGILVPFYVIREAYIRKTNKIGTYKALMEARLKKGDLEATSYGFGFKTPVLINPTA